MRARTLLLGLALLLGCSPSSSPDAGVCDATTCQGCCRNGACVEGLANDACGSTGEACQACSAQQTCVLPLGGAARCVPVPCPGGCDGGCCDTNTGTCQAGSNRTACGARGETCRECNLQQYCVSRAGEFTCAGGSCTGDCDGGCCDNFTGTCLPGTTTSACGGGGAWCRGCAGSCVNQACQ